MRGSDTRQGSLFSYVNLDNRIPAKHPIRKLRLVVDIILSTMDAEFSSRYADTGRPSIPPEQLLRALLLQVMYSIRSERQLVEQLDYNLLYRWFVGLGVDDKIWDRTTFCANRDRLLNDDVLRIFFDKVVHFARWRKLASDTHFSVDGSMIEAWASHKSFVRKDRDKSDDDKGQGGSGGGRNAEVDFKGESRSNETHESTTDPSARLYKKGKFTEAKLRHITHIVSENRHGLVMDVETTPATGKAEWEAAERMARRTLNKGDTLGADKGYDTEEHIKALKAMGVKPHVAAKKTGSAMNPRTVRSKGYQASLRKRKLVEEAFGWAKTVGGFRKTRFIGTAKAHAQALLTFAAYNLTRMMTLFGWREDFLQAKSACRV